MSSIRPLITITILVVVGVVLYVKINEGTVHPTPAAGDAWNQPIDGVPPLASSSVAPTTSDGAAPPWPATTSAPAPNASPTDAASAIAPAAATNATELLPAVPAIPEMPEITATTQADAATTPSAPLPTGLPANIPEARYPDQIPATEASVQVDATIGGVPTVGASPVGTAPAATAPAATNLITAQEAATTPEQMNEATAAASGLSSAPTPLEANPLRPSTQSTPLDRYGANAAATTPIEPAATTSPSAQSFVESWPAIQAALDRGELAEAHKLLTRWHGDASLTPTDAERVDALLSQLAGTVVYSTEHRLAPAHVVKPGETLETIAKEYNVPWQLLAKINGVAAANQLRPGQELKVMRGPFSAVVELSRNQLTLMVDGRYAGKFPVSVAPGQAIDDGEWVVGKKSVEQAPAHAILLQGSAASPGSPAPMLVIASNSLPVNSASGSTITVSPQDAEELTDILSIGSRVITRR